MQRSSSSTSSTKSVAWYLSLGGFMPFAALSFGLFLLGQQHALYPTLFDIFKVWSAIILSFLGGIRWGFAIANEPDENTNLVLSVVPSILAWFAILLPDAYTILALSILFAAHGVWDSFYMNQGKIAPWFGPIRITLTLLVVAAHILVLFSIA